MSENTTIAGGYTGVSADPLSGVANIINAISTPILGGIGLYQNKKNYEQQQELLEYPHAQKYALGEPSDTQEVLAAVHNFFYFDIIQYHQELELK